MAHPNRPSTPTEELAAVGTEFYKRGWWVGNSGSMSVLLARKPARLCITSTGGLSAEIEPSDLLEIDDDAEILHGFGKPADETLLHLTIYRRRPRARCILFSRSVAGTVVSDRNFTDGSVSFRGYEVLKALPGITSYDQTVSIPIIENSSDLVALSHVLDNVLHENANAHALLIRRNGLYVWGETVEAVRTMVEVLEFLFEVAALNR